jgi:hypothetical protein
MAASPSWGAVSIENAAMVRFHAPVSVPASGVGKREGAKDVPLARFLRVA